MGFGVRVKLGPLVYTEQVERRPREARAPISSRLRSWLILGGLLAFLAALAVIGALIDAGVGGR